MPGPFQKAKATRQCGFTLLEVMLVLVLMGLAVGVVIFNVNLSDNSEALEKQARRFQVVFDMASDYAILNQQQLGLRVEEDDFSYRFLILDEEQNWQFLTEDKIFDIKQLEEPFSLELQLDGLPWQTEGSLFDNDLFDEQLSVSDEEVEIGKEEEEKVEPPQVLLFPSGEITPFSMIFKFEPNFGNEEPAYFRLNAVDDTPLEIEGPLDLL